MVIDFNKLDTRKGYVVLEYGTSLVSKLIDDMTEDYCPEVKHRPSHVLALKYNGYCWQIYESHMLPAQCGNIPAGTRTYSEYTFKEEFPNTIKNGVVYPFRTNLAILKKFLNQPYGVGDIISLGKAYFLNNNGKQKNREGFICSEYIAMSNQKFRKYFKLPAHCITPAHFLKYMIDNNIQPVE